VAVRQIALFAKDGRIAKLAIYDRAARSRPWLSSDGRAGASLRTPLPELLKQERLPSAEGRSK
jgi:hypothetical protein